jgi:threonine dehydratase
MENGVVVNGKGIENGRPRTPSLNTLSLTEYSTNPSPPSESPRSKVKGVIPDEFILPNGYPDVGLSLLFQLISNIWNSTCG